MADNDVRIKLSLDGADEVKSGLAGVGEGASTADSKLGGLVSGGLKGAGVALVGFATAAVAAGGALIGGVVGQFAQYEQNIGGIETMFKDSAGKMEQYADEAFKTAGLSANQYMEQVTSFSASLLQGLGGDTEAAAVMANTAMVDMSDNANKFGSNIADIQNAYQGFAKQNYTMLDNLKLGYGGTASEMARLINDSGVLGDTMEVTAETVNDVSFDQIIEAIHVVQEEMGIAGTTALEAEKTISGSIGMLKSSFSNLLTGLGSADADVATLAGNVISSFESVVNNITPVIETIGSNMGTLGPKIGSMIEGVIGTVVAAVPAVLEAGTAIIGGLISGISSAAPGLITAIVPAVVGLVEMIATQLPLLVDAGIQAVIALAQGLVIAVPELLPAVAEMIVGLVDAIVSNLPALLEVALQLILALADGLLEALPILLEAMPAIVDAITVFLLDSIPMIMEAGYQLFTAIIAALPEIISIIVEAIPQIISSLVERIQSSWPEMSAAGLALLVSLVQDIGSAASQIAGRIPEVITAIANAVRSGISQMVSAGAALIEGVWTGITSQAGALTERVRSWASGLVSTVKSALQISSPSKVMDEEIGQQLPPGIGQGINKSKERALTPLRDLSDTMVEEAKKALKLETAITMSTISRTPVAAAMATPSSYRSYRPSVGSTRFHPDDIKALAHALDSRPMVVQPVVRDRDLAAAVRDHNRGVR